MTWLLRGVAVLVALHTSWALLGASVMSFQANVPPATRAGIAAAVLIIAVLSGWAIISIWRLRWAGALAIGIAYAALALGQISYLVSGDFEFSRGSVLIFATVALVLLSPQTRRACVKRARQSEASEYTP